MLNQDKLPRMNLFAITLIIVVHIMIKLVLIILGGYETSFVNEYNLLCFVELVTISKIWQVTFFKYGRFVEYHEVVLALFLAFSSLYFNKETSISSCLSKYNDMALLT